jgi:putative membrane protein
MCGSVKMEVYVLLISLLIGVLLGAVAGLLPGLHPNTISQLLSSLNYSNPLIFAIAIIVSAAVNNMVALLPAIFLFIPDSDSVLSILPAQRLVLQGKGKIAVLVCASAAALTLFFLLFLLPISYLILPFLYSIVKPFTALILIIASLFFIFSEEKENRFKSLFIFLLSGLFGVLLILSNLSGLIADNTLFIVFIGFFALSSIFLSLGRKTLIPQQEQREYKLEFGKIFLLIVLLSTFIGALADLFPAINSPAQLATFISPLANTPVTFLAATTSITVSHYANSIVAFDRIGKARTGTLINVGELVKDIDFNTTILFVVFYFIGTAIGIILLLILSDYAINLVNNIDQKMMNIFILFFLISTVILSSGLFGFIICLISTAIGLLPPLLGVRRTHLMAFLIVPSILINISL